MDATPTKGVSDHDIENLVMLYEEQKVAQAAVARMADAGLGEQAKYLPITNDIDTRAADSLGVGGSFLTAGSRNYGSLGAVAEWMGNKVTGIINDFKKNAKEGLDPSLYKLAQNPEAAIEYSTLNAQLRNIPEKYIIDVEGKQFKHAATFRWEQDMADTTKAFDDLMQTNPSVEKLNAARAELDKLAAKKPTIATPDAPVAIPIKTKEALDVAKVHVETNGKRLNGIAPVRTAQGGRFNRDPEVFYPTPVDPKDYPFFGIVVDESITAGWGRHKTLYATSAEELQKMSAKITQGNPQLKVRFAKDAEDWYASNGQFAQDKTLTDNYLDTLAQRKGVSAPYIVPTDPQKVVSDLLSWHMERETAHVRELVLAKYEKQFEELNMLGESFTNAQTSKFSGIRRVKHVEEVVENPYTDYIKTALGVPKTTNYPLWTNFNRMADKKVSQVLNAVSGAVHRAKSIDELEDVNAMLESAGYKGAAYDADMEIFANSSMPRGKLEGIVRKSNSLLATVVLRLDAINSINNAVSANVLLGSETKAILRAIDKGDANAVGALAKIGVPGTGQKILSPTKMIAKSFGRYYKMLRGDEELRALKEFYTENRFITSISDQHKWTMDNLTMTGKETIQTAEGKVKLVHDKLKDWADKGEKWTGNRHAEEMNRFVAADVMMQITDIAIKQGVMSPRQRLSYINTFVNRTQGNYLAAQRPGMFKGPIGQSIGLFQTYQFNLMQQLLRHVGEGGAKDAMTMMAMQATIHGMNGLPAFHAVNNHIIGTASGNENHRDLYDTTYGLVGKEAGDWLLYGAGSNAIGLLHPDLKFNLYTRGDINPRHLTVVPTNVSDIPIVSAYSKFLGNLYDTGKKLIQGGDVGTTLLQGFEHNGISRPLAGLAQTLEATTNPNLVSYSTSKKGNIVASNDLVSLSNLARIAGAKPLDEAIAIDSAYRINAYGLKDAKKRRVLGSALKTHMMAGNLPATDMLLDFQGKYMEYGGQQENFSKWVRTQYKSANLSQANKLAEDLGSWESQAMQKIMGGDTLDDFYDKSPEE